MFEAPLIWALLLLVLGLALLVLELFIPSGGVLGFLAGCAVLGSMFMALRHENSTVAYSIVALEVVGISIALSLIMRWWPNTPLGKRIVPDLPTSHDVLPDDDPQSLKELIGKTGQAKSLMLPAGAIAIEGRTINAISEGMAIEAGQTVRVVDVRGYRVVVHPVDDLPPIDEAKSDSDDVLSQSIEDLGLDPLDDPLA